LIKQIFPCIVLRNRFFLKFFDKGDEWMLSQRERFLLAQIFTFDDPDPWTLQKEFLDLPKIPFKIDIRHATRALPELKQLIVQMLLQKLNNLDWFKDCDGIAEIPEAMSFVVSSIQDILQVPAVSINPKTGRVLGRTFSGMKLAVIEDVFAHGRSRV